MRGRKSRTIRLPSVEGDETQLVQLMQNLIANGIKFHGDQPPKVHISARQDCDETTFSVRDNGIGIERQYWEQIFVIFQRLHSGRSILARVLDWPSASALSNATGGAFGWSRNRAVEQRFTSRFHKTGEFALWRRSRDGRLSCC